MRKMKSAKNCRFGILVRLHKFGVIARLDRAIQYSRDDSAPYETPLEYWMPRIRGA
jgi:hypothetical protein